MSKDILVFRRQVDEKRTVNIDAEFNLKVWRPNLFNLIPPNKDYKYLIYWLFHFLKIFRNSCYAAYLLYKDSELASSCLIIPSHFKWPFMESKDVQFTYVMTSDKYRGRGLAGKLLEKAIADLSDEDRAFWYVTNTKNKASIKVAEKMGFKNVGKARKYTQMNILKLNREKNFNN